MNQFRSFVHKEFLHIFRDSRTMLILLVMPVVLISLFGFVISTEVKNSRVCVVDLMQTETSRTLTAAIDANAYFCVADVRHDTRHTEELMQRGAVDAVVVLDSERGVQILVDGSEPNQAQVRAAQLAQIMTASPPALHQGGGAVVRMLFNPQMKSEYNFVPAIIGMVILLICAMMTSISIVREKEMGTMEVLLASPVRPLTIILAKLVPYFAVSSIDVLMILVLAKWFFALPMVTWSVAGVFVLLAMIYIFVALALGMLISCAVRSQLAAMLLSILLIVPTVYLSGMVFPIESLPTPFQNASRIVPARWFMGAARRLLIQGVEMRYVVREFAVLGLEAIVLIAISLKLFKRRLE